MKTYTVVCTTTVLNKSPWVDVKLLNLVFDASKDTCIVVSSDNIHTISTSTRLMGINVMSALKRSGYKILSSENI